MAQSNVIKIQWKAMQIDCHGNKHLTHSLVFVSQNARKCQIHFKQQFLLLLTDDEQRIWPH